MEHLCSTRLPQEIEFQVDNIENMHGAKHAYNTKGTRSVTGLESAANYVVHVDECQLR